MVNANQICMSFGIIFQVSLLFSMVSFLQHSPKTHGQGKHLFLVLFNASHFFSTDATVLKNLSILLVNYMNFLCRSSSENVYRVATFKVAISMLLAQINDDITILCLYCVSIFVLEEDNKPYRLDPAVYECVSNLKSSQNTAIAETARSILSVTKKKTE